MNYVGDMCIYKSLIKEKKGIMCCSVTAEKREPSLNIACATTMPRSSLRNSAAWTRRDALTDRAGLLLAFSQSSFGLRLGTTCCVEHAVVLNTAI